MIERFSRAFSLWVSAASVLALFHPPLFSWFITGRIPLGSTRALVIEGGLVTPGLQFIMLAMGLTLRGEELRLVLARKAEVLLGVVLQFSVMPLLGFSVAQLFSLPQELAAGLILVCCCPGGTASNVIAFLAKADLALSVAMTTVSTLLAAVCTPWLTSVLLQRSVEMDVLGLYVTTAQVVLLPVVLGIVLRRFGGAYIETVLVLLPALAVVSIVLIVAGIIAVQRDKILQSGFLVLVAVTTVHGAAFALGYFLSRLRGSTPSVARTISIEVGMQNSGLGVVLARASFANPLVAVAPAISAVVHCLYGSALAAFWGRASGQVRAKREEEHALP